MDLLNTLVVVDLSWDRNGHSLTACESHRPGPWMRGEDAFIMRSRSSWSPPEIPYMAGLVEGGGGGAFPAPSGPLSGSWEHLPAGNNRTSVYAV